MISRAKRIREREETGKLGNADRLRDDVVFVDWVLVGATVGVADVVLECQAIEPSCCAEAVLGAVYSVGTSVLFVRRELGMGKGGRGETYTA